MFNIVKVIIVKCKNPIRLFNNLHFKIKKIIIFFLILPTKFTVYQFLFLSTKHRYYYYVPLNRLSETENKSVAIS